MLKCLGRGSLGITLIQVWPEVLSLSVGLTLGRQGDMLGNAVGLDGFFAPCRGNFKRLFQNQNWGGEFATFFIVGWQPQGYHRILSAEINLTKGLCLISELCSMHFTVPLVDPCQRSSPQGKPKTFCIMLWFFLFSRALVVDGNWVFMYSVQ